MSQHDRNFDDLAERFAKKVYGGLKGDIRLAIIWRDLQQKIPELMRGIGKGIREFNTARASVERELKEGMHDEKKG